MKKIVLQFWRKVRYGDRRQFKFWSARMTAAGDQSLMDTVHPYRMKDWKKVAIFSPSGVPDTVFFVGFSDIFGNTKISSIPRRIKDGLFGLRLGPDDCQFFVCSNDGEVGLTLAEYTTIDAEARADTPLY